MVSKQEYKKIVNESNVSSNFIKNCIIAFVSGGLVAIFGQIILDLSIKLFEITLEDAMPIVSVVVIFFTSLLTGFGVYDKFGQVCGAGLFIPISGFANSLTSAAMESKSEGLIYGIGSNMFKLAGSVIVYGIVSVYFISIIKYFLGVLNIWPQ